MKKKYLKIKMKKIERFKKLAPKRFQSVLKALASFSNLSDKYRYSWTNVEVKVMIETMKKSIETIEERFKDSKVEVYNFKKSKNEEE